MQTYGSGVLAPKVQYFKDASNWNDSLKSYRDEVRRPTDFAEREQPYKPTSRLQDPVSHQFKNPKDAEEYKSSRRNLEIQALNHARDHQLKFQGTFGFIDQKDHYAKQMPELKTKKQMEAYEYTMTYGNDINKTIPTTKPKQLQQTESTLIKETFSNNVYVNQPIFGAKNRDVPHSKGKHHFPDRAAQKLVIGYMGVQDD